MATEKEKTAAKLKMIEEAAKGARLLGSEKEAKQFAKEHIEPKIKPLGSTSSKVPLPTSSKPT